MVAIFYIIINLFYSLQKHLLYTYEILMHISSLPDYDNDDDDSYDNDNDNDGGEMVIVLI